MRLKRCLSIGLMLVILVPLMKAQEPQMPFESFTEITDFGNFLCDMWFLRGEPPCLKESSPALSYIYYPTRAKSKIIVDMFTIQGLYEEELLVSFFGALATGTWHPAGNVSVGEYWDSMYYAFDKLDRRVEAKKFLLDIVFDRGWAAGKYTADRYKALQTLSSERIITLREYKPLVEYLRTEIAKPEPDMNWVNALVDSLSSFREWNEELLPLFRSTFDILKPGHYTHLLKALLDFESRDDGEFLVNHIVENRVTEFGDQKMVIRAAYVLDYEIVSKRLAEYLRTGNPTPDLKDYIEGILTRINWYGNWEITDSKDTVDAGLKDEVISFRMANTLSEYDDEVTFSMPMQINDPVFMKPIGMEETPLTNWIHFEISPGELVFEVENPADRSVSEKHFTIEEGKGRDSGKFYLKFPLEGQTDSKGQPKHGFIEIEKIS